MSEAVLRVQACGPLVSYQDAGRFGLMRFGVPASGPMDRLAHAAAHAALHNPAGATALEVSAGGLALVCESGEVSFSVTGGDFRVEHAGSVCPCWCVRTLRAGDRLAIRPGAAGSWAYLAFRGELHCGRWAGHTATHAPSGLGGGMLGSGEPIVVRQAQVLPDREGVLPRPGFMSLGSDVRVVLGPQTGHFQPEAVTALLNERFAVTPAFDRMGMRIAGPVLALADALSIPSEPVVRGAIQVGGDAVASILLADHQTTGGYPKIATILSSDTDAVAQRRPGDRLAFRAVDLDDAVRIVRAHRHASQQFLNDVAGRRLSLQERLAQENLISGVVCV